MILRVGARASPLSRVQVQEVEQELKLHFPSVQFSPYFVETKGDKNLKISLRALDKTDFFTQEVDELVLKGICRAAIHSAKDLPYPLPAGLKIAAITRGIDASDSLVFREDEYLDTLPLNALIATSSHNREAAVRKLRPDFKFCDLRGTIHQRLKLIKDGRADGIVVAEAALIRLGLTHLNRLRLSVQTTPLQGKLAIVIRQNDQILENLFGPLDERRLPLGLYLGPTLPQHAFKDHQIMHVPLIHTTTRLPSDPAIAEMLKKWPVFTHLILTSKTAVRALEHHLRRQHIPLSSLKTKTVFAVGSATAKALKDLGVLAVCAEQEQAEGLFPLIETIPGNGHVLFPHSSLARTVITEALRRKNVSFYACTLYDTELLQDVLLPDLTRIPEVIFSCPSTVRAFFSLVPSPPNQLKFRAIGPITAAELAKYTFFTEN